MSFSMMLICKTWLDSSSLWASLKASSSDRIVSSFCSYLILIYFFLGTHNPLLHLLIYTSVSLLHALSGLWACGSLCLFKMLPPNSDSGNSEDSLSVGSLIEKTNFKNWTVTVVDHIDSSIGRNIQVQNLTSFKIKQSFNQNIVI